MSSIRGLSKKRESGSPSNGVAVRALLDTLQYSRERGYTGWDYGDGLSSRILRGLPVDNRWINLIFQETVKRAPVNVRPLLLVEQRRNFLGAGLFAMANLTVDRFRREHDGGDVADSGVDYAGEAVELLDWLVQNRCRGYSGFCGSDQHRSQSLTETYTCVPSVTPTAIPTRALLRAGDLDPVFSAVGRTAADFIAEDLAYREESGGAVIKYLPNDSWDYVTPNAIALGARLLVDLYATTGEETLAERAGKLLDYVASLQTDTGGWYYRQPPDASHMSMDNFHNGFIIESLLRYEEVLDTTRYEDTLDSALQFYRTDLFEANGAPNWDESFAYPRDVHAAAQGIIVFSHAGEFERAGRILSWALDNLYAGDGRFYFRKHRLYTKRFTLMRWCQAWMSYAISEYVACRTFDDPPM